jgi:TrmH family RNA methyltransferase
MKIESLQHPLVKRLVKLRGEKRARQEEKQVVVAGVKLIADLAKHYPIAQLLIEEGSHFPDLPGEKIVVTAEILKKITGLAAPEPLAAVVPLPEQKNLSGKKRVIALDGVADPGNMGTLIRTAWALGCDGMYVVDGSTDPFNDKALRAAQGATFQLPLQFGGVEELVSLIATNRMHAFVADLHGESIGFAEHPYVLILGSETHGIRPELKQKFKAVTIPMKNGVDSLNVAVAGAILIYALQERR